jgi:hypothetical protein
VQSNYILIKSECCIRKRLTERMKYKETRATSVKSAVNYSLLHVEISITNFTETLSVISHDGGQKTLTIMG